VSTLSVTGLDFVIIAFYMLALLVIGLLSEVAIRALDNYLLANRQLSYLLYVPVTAATPG
jgi:Na+/proline symporter